MLKFLFGLCLVVGVWGKHELYDGHALYEVSVTFADQVHTLDELRSKLDIDVWSSAVPGRPGNVLVPKILRESFEDALKADGIEYKVEVENIKEKLDLEDSLLKASDRSRVANRSTSISFDIIHTYDEVNAILEKLAKDYPRTVTLVTAGKSFEGRDIKYVKISSDGFQSNKPTVFMQSLIHARDWMSLPTTLYAIEKLVLDVQEPDLLRNLDWIILPIANPDGYVHSELARFWVKNRRGGFIDGDVCLGVDLDRNFDAKWAPLPGGLLFNNPCQNDFHGEAPFSEPESIIIRDIFAQNNHKIRLFVDVRSFGSNILYGYGNGELPPNVLAKHVLGVNMAQAIDAVKWPSNPNYVVGNTMAVKGSGSGSPSDYALQVGTAFSYVIELPPYLNLNSLFGYFVDPEFIEQAGYETWEAVKVGARFVVNTSLRKDMLR